MGVRTIDTPNGPVDFPDNMSDEAIAGVLKNEFPTGKIPYAGLTQEKTASTPSATFTQQVLASPAGRLTRNAVVDPALSLLAVPGHAQAKLFSAGGAYPNPLSNINEKIAGGVDSARQYLDSGYDAANAAVRQTPTYLKAKAKADAVQGEKPAGFMDAVLSPVAPSLAGVAAYGTQALGNLFTDKKNQIPASDAMNAAMDTQQTGQNAYAAENPVPSFAAGLLPAVLMGAPRATLPVRASGQAASVAPATDAARRFVSQIAASRGVTPDMIAQRGVDTFGKPITGAEAIGTPATTHLGALTRQSGTTGADAQSLFSGRAAERYGRQQGDFAAATGTDPLAAQGDINALVQKGQAAASPLYDEAYAAPPLNPDHIAPGGKLDRLMARPSMKQAAKNALSVAAEEGRDPASLGITFNPAGDPIFEKVPSWQTLNYMKRGLDDYLNDFRDKVTQKLPRNNNQVEAVKDTLGKYRTFLKDENPAYGKALAVSGDYLSARSAFDWAGKALFDSTIPEAVFTKRIGEFDPVAQSAARGGGANRLFDMTQNNRLTPAVMRSPRVRAKLESLYGRQGAEEFIRRAEVENQMRVGEARIPADQNSVTSGVGAAINEQTAFGAPNEHLANAVNDFVGSGGSIKGTAASTISRHARALLDAWMHRGMSEEVRNEAGRLLQLSPDDLATELRNHIRAVPQTNASPIRHTMLRNIIFMQSLGNLASKQAVQ